MGAVRGVVGTPILLPHKVEDMAETERVERPVLFVGRSAKELRTFPKRAQDRLMTDLRRVQRGMAPTNEKPLYGLKDAVRELRTQTNQGAHRLAYAPGVIPPVAVLHAFTKTSESDTPRAVVVCKERIKMARLLAEDRT